MHFDAKNRMVYEPEIRILDPFYYILKKYAPSLKGSPIYEELIDVYESLELDLKEEQRSGSETV